MSEIKYSLKNILPFLPKKHRLHRVENLDMIHFSKVTSLSEADNETLIFIDSNRVDKQSLYEDTKGGILICDFNIQIDPSKKQIVIQVDEPKLVFSIVANDLFVKRPKWGVHPNAYVDVEADIHPETYIGPFSHIGKCRIGQGSIIYGNCYLYDRIAIGKNVIVHAGTVLGADGFGYIRTGDDFPVQFPHVGNIVIEDHVEIGANTAIDQGALGATRIRYASKIDNLVHIGHNVEIGKCCYVAAHASIAGSSVIGDYSEVWMGAGVADGLKIGPRTTLGIGSVVIRDVSEKKRVFGNPARIISEN